MGPNIALKEVRDSNLCLLYFLLPTIWAASVLGA